jgi:DNA-directed RNA polymerase specialized sigma24 family protein
MVHCAISRYRKLKPMVLVEDFAAEEAAAIPISSSFNDNGLEAKDLMKLVQKLPKTYRSVFNMYAIEGYSHQEIGSSLGMSELLSRTTLHRARTLLKDMVAKLTLREEHCLAG